MQHMKSRGAMARESWCLDTIGQGHPELALFRRRLRAVDGVNSLGELSFCDVFLLMTYMRHVCSAYSYGTTTIFCCQFICHN